MERVTAGDQGPTSGCRAVEEEVEVEEEEEEEEEVEEVEVEGGEEEKEEVEVDEEEKQFMPDFATRYQVFSLFFNLHLMHRSSRMM